MSVLPNFSTYESYSKRIVQEGCIPGPRPRVPGVITDQSFTYQATPDYLLPALRFVLVGDEGPSTTFRVRYVTQDVVPGSPPTTGSLTSATFQSMDTDGTSETDAYDIEYQEFDFKKLSKIVAIDSVIARSSAAEAVLQAQIELARHSLRWGLGASIVNGSDVTAGSGELNGLKGVTLTATPQADLSLTSAVAYVNDDAASERKFLREVFQLKRRATTSSGPTSAEPDAFVTSDRVIERIVNAQIINGCTPEFRDCPLVGGLNCHYVYGIPVLPAPVDETSDKANLYAVKLKGPSGLQVAHMGGRPQDHGITVERLPKDPSTGAMSAIVQGYYTLVVPESHSVVALKEIEIPSANFPV